MTFLLVAINASYSHTSLAVRSLSACTGIPFCEFTINQPVGEILRGIYRENPDVVLFSTYIWNAEIICKIMLTGSSQCRRGGFPLSIAQSPPVRAHCRGPCDPAFWRVQPVPA